MGAMRHLRLLLVFSLVLALASPLALAEGKSAQDSQTQSSELKAKLERLNEQIKKEADNATVYAQRSQVLRKLGDVPESLKSINKAIELDSANPAFLQTRAVIFMSDKQDAKAIADLTKAIGMGQKSAKVYAARGSARLVTNDFKGALNDANVALELDPKYSFAWFIKGSASCELGDTETGLTFLNKAVKAEPNDPNYVHRRALAYQKIGQSNKAKSDFTRAKQLGFESTSEADGSSKHR